MADQTSMKHPISSLKGCSIPCNTGTFFGTNSFHSIMDIFCPFKVVYCHLTVSLWYLFTLWYLVSEEEPFWYLSILTPTHNVVVVVNHLDVLRKLDKYNIDFLIIIVEIFQRLVGLVFIACWFLLSSKIYTQGNINLLSSTFDFSKLSLMYKQWSIRALRRWWCSQKVI